ncbi:hypothetical protein BDP27DRAFT_1428216 [Rhodocollybia butyracea]|uniref:Uncharacterized protein n=1 Tax=Rhodocollybia butyracea TaxID=206335 RepID=A0A9P5U032_9AGAR|nr:hypothetical protein BDP27DRAFT_1428216 [Rhodocollybia butyracea]
MLDMVDKGMALTGNSGYSRYGFRDCYIGVWSSDGNPQVSRTHLHQLSLSFVNSCRTAFEHSRLQIRLPVKSSLTSKIAGCYIGVGSSDISFWKLAGTYRGPLSFVNSRRIAFEPSRLPFDLSKFASNLVPTLIRLLHLSQAVFFCLFLVPSNMLDPSARSYQAQLPLTSLYPSRLILTMSLVRDDERLLHLDVPTHRLFAASSRHMSGLEQYDYNPLLDIPYFSANGFETSRYHSADSRAGLMSAMYNHVQAPRAVTHLLFRIGETASAISDFAQIDVTALRYLPEFDQGHGFTTLETKFAMSNKTPCRKNLATNGTSNTLSPLPLSHHPIAPSPMHNSVFQTRFGPDTPRVPPPSTPFVVNQMLFTVPYASFLLVASLSCIWATPIAVDRNTLQRRSRSDLGLRTTETGPLEARDRRVSHLKAEEFRIGHPVESAAKKGSSESPRVPQKISHFSFTLSIPVVVNPSVKEGSPKMIEEVEKARKKARKRAKDFVERVCPDFSVDFSEKPEAKVQRFGFQPQQNIPFTFSMNGKTYLARLGSAGTGEGDELWKDGTKIYPKV